MNWDPSWLLGHGSSLDNATEKLHPPQDQAQAALQSFSPSWRSLRPRDQPYVHSMADRLMPPPQDEIERDIWQGYDQTGRLPASGHSHGLDCPIRASPGGSSKCGWRPKDRANGFVDMSRVKEHVANHGLICTDCEACFTSSSRWRQHREYRAAQKRCVDVGSDSKKIRYPLRIAPEALDKFFERTNGRTNKSFHVLWTEGYQALHEDWQSHAGGVPSPFYRQNTQREDMEHLRPNVDRCVPAALRPATPHQRVRHGSLRETPTPTNWSDDYFQGQHDPLAAPQHFYPASSQAINGNTSGHASLDSIMEGMESTNTVSPSNAWTPSSPSCPAHADQTWTGIGESRVGNQTFPPTVWTPSSDPSNLDPNSNWPDFGDTELPSVEQTHTSSRAESDDASRYNNSLFEENEALREETTTYKALVRKLQHLNTTSKHEVARATSHDAKNRINNAFRLSIDDLIAKFGDAVK